MIDSRRRTIVRRLTALSYLLAWMQEPNTPPEGGSTEEDHMSKRTWYLVGLVLFAGACNPVLESPIEPYVPDNRTVESAAQQATPVTQQPHGKKRLDQELQ